MKKILKLLLTSVLLLSMAACSTSNTSSDSTASNTEVTNSAEYTDWTQIFDSSKVVDMNIEIDETDLQAMFDNAMDEEYYSASITMDGITLENIGIRTKGASSLSSVAKSDSDRYGFKIKTDEYVDDQTLLGLDKFVLNASFSDPSYMREYLTYTAASELGLTTPEIVYTNVYVNGELFGFYLAVESYDDTFVDSITSDEDAVLYKADSETNTLKSTDDASGFEIDEGEDEGNSNVQNLISVLNSTTSDNTADLEAILDIDSVLKSAALNNVMGNYDSYSGSKAHNYYLLYHDGKFEYIGWDYNMSMGGFPEDNGSSVNVDIEDPYFMSSATDRPLISQLLAIDKYNDQYLEYVQELVDYLGDFETQVQDLSSLISTYVENDPTAYYEYSDYLLNISASDTDLTTITANSARSNQQRPDAQTTTDTQNGDVAMIDEDTKAAVEALIAEGIDIRTLDETQIQALIDEGKLPADFTLQQDPMNMQQPNTDAANTQPAADANTQQRPDATNAQPAADAANAQPEATTDQQGALPTNQMGGNQMGGSSELSSAKVSIIDYITQRIEIVQAQLTK